MSDEYDIVHDHFGADEPEPAADAGPEADLGDVDEDCYLDDDFDLDDGEYEPSRRSSTFPPRRSRPTTAAAGHPPHRIAASDRPSQDFISSLYVQSSVPGSRFQAPA